MGEHGGGGGSIRDLFITLGIKGEAHEKLQEMEERLGEVKHSLIEVGEALLAAFAVERLHEFMEAQTGLAANIVDTSEKMGVATDELQRFQFAAEQSGSSAESMTGALKFLNRNINSAATGTGQVAEEFAKAHISVKNADGSLRSAGDVMKDVADAVQKLPPGAQRVGLAMRLMGRGGSELIPTLSKGREGLEELAKEADETGGVLGKEYLERAKKAEDATKRMEFAWRGTKATLTNALLPAFETFTAWMEKGGKLLHKLLDHTTAIRVAFGVLAGVAAFKLAPALLSLVKAVSGVGSEAGLLSTALGAIEFVAVILLVALLVLAFDDLWGTLEGKDSVIQDLIDHFMGFGTTKQLVDELTKAWDNLTGALDGLGITLPGIGEMFSNFINFNLAMAADSLQMFAKLITTVINGVARVVEMAQAAGKVATDLASGNWSKSDQEIVGRIKKMAGLTLSDFGAGVKDAMPMGPNAVLAQQGRVAEWNRMADIAKKKQEARDVHITQHIQTTADPKAVGDGAEQGVRDAMSDFQNDNAFESFGLPEAED